MNFCEIFILSCLSVTAFFDGARGFKRSLNSKSYAFQQVSFPVRSGMLAQKLEVRPGDCGHNESWDDCSTDRERIEFTSNEKFRMGDERWISWSLFIPRDFKDVSPTKTTLGQIHQIEGPSGTTAGFASHPPLIQFDILNGEYILRHHVLSGSVEKVTDKSNLYKLISLESMRGMWTDVLLHIKFDKEKGYCEVYLNGDLKAKIPNELVNFPPQSFYFKYGVYRSFISRYENLYQKTIPGQIVYFDEVRIGKNRFEVDSSINKNLNPLD